LSLERQGRAGLDYKAHRQQLQRAGRTNSGVMDDETPPAKPRLSFGRGRAASADRSPRAAREHVPVHDALSRMAGKIGDRRRAMGPAQDDDPDGTAASTA
jgi:hypothetical protein